MNDSDSRLKTALVVGASTAIIATVCYIFSGSKKKDTIKSNSNMPNELVTIISDTYPLTDTNNFLIDSDIANKHNIELKLSDNNVVSNDSIEEHSELNNEASSISETKHSIHTYESPSKEFYESPSKESIDSETFSQSTKDYSDRKAFIDAAKIKLAELAEKAKQALFESSFYQGTILVVSSI